MTRLLAALSTLIFITVATGCSHDCDRLADLSCARLGEQTEECERVREQAARASADDKRMCKLALSVADDFAGQP